MASIIRVRDVRCPRCNCYSRPRIVALARIRRFEELIVVRFTPRKRTNVAVPRLSA